LNVDTPIPNLFQICPAGDLRTACLGSYLTEVSITLLDLHEPTAENDNEKPGNLFRILSGMFIVTNSCKEEQLRKSENKPSVILEYLVNAIFGTPGIMTASFFNAAQEARKKCNPNSLKIILVYFGGAESESRP
jgi:hypothetical protein